MIKVSSIFWVAGLMLSVVLGFRLGIWTWGPAMLCFALAAALAIPSIWKNSLASINPFIFYTGIVTTIWFSLRACFSPVQELAMMDLFLIGMAVSTFVVISNAFQDKAAQIIIVLGIALLLIANLAVMGAQIKDPEFFLAIPRSNHTYPTGFYGHYSHTSLFLIVSSLLLAGFSIKSSWPKFAKTGLVILSIMGLAAVYVTKSRSGMIGAGTGFITLLIYWLMTVKRDDKKWGGLVLVLAPILLIIIGIVALSFLKDVEETRSDNQNLVEMMDNSIRLYLYGISVSCFFLHPFIGGGSRSFSWECYRFWDPESMGHIDRDPQHVHNELVQSATDYGIIGAGLILSLLVGIWIICTFRSLFKGSWQSFSNSDAWRIGGIAALVGLFVQSNFEGVLRTAPGAVMLGLCFAAAIHGLTKETVSKPIKLSIRNSALTLIAIISVCGLTFYGIKGSLVSIDLWSAVFSKKTVTTENQITAYSKALKTWQFESLYAERAALYHNFTNEPSQKDNYGKLLNLALDDYKSAIALNPYRPVHSVNAANVMSLLKLNQQASAEFEKAIDLQGGMETAFKAHYFYARHLNYLGYYELALGDPELAFKYLEATITHLGQSVHYIIGEPFYDLQVTAHTNLARAWEKRGDYQKALEQYDATSLLINGARANFSSSIMLQSRGEDLVSKKQLPEALRLFNEALRRIQSFNAAQLGITEEDREFTIRDIQADIEPLTQKQIQPSADIRFE